MFLAGTRYLSAWLNLSGPSSIDSYSEGSPVDRLVFLIIIVWGSIVLYRRRLRWSQLLASNWLLVAYLLFCLSSVLWTDEPWVLLKRWAKDLGNPIMALIMLTERRPYNAVARTLRRLSFVTLPLSIVFIRYYPELGRGYKVDGSPMYTGVGNDKNALGMICLIAGIYYFWHFLHRRSDVSTSWQRLGDGVFICVIVYLLRLADSQTSTACLILSVGLLLLAKVTWIAQKPTRVLWILLCAVVVGGGLEYTIHLRDSVFAMMGRDPSLTNRVELWDVVRPLQVNSLVGSGFMSFWAGERMEVIWSRLGTSVNQAHNGYLEQYLNLGYVGVSFIVLMILSGLWNAKRMLELEPAQGVLWLCFVSTAVLYNVTEASFYGLNNIWVLFLLSCIDVSRLQESHSRALVGWSARASRASALAGAGARFRSSSDGVNAAPYVSWRHASAPLRARSRARK